jgi:hypothetical protein
MLYEILGSIYNVSAQGHFNLGLATGKACCRPHSGIF